MAAKDVIFIAVAVFVAVVGFFIFHSVSTTITNEMQNITAINESPEAVQALQDTAVATSRMDMVAFAFFIGLLFALIITGWFVGGHPIFMFIYILAIVVGVIVAAILSNVWEEVTVMPVFGGTILDFPIMNHLINNFPYYIAVVGIIGLLAMFGKAATTKD